MVPETKRNSHNGASSNHLPSSHSVPLPEILIKSQVSHENPNTSCQYINSAIDDSSFSSNLTLSKHDSSDTSFSDEEEDYEEDKEDLDVKMIEVQATTRVRKGEREGEKGERKAREKREREREGRKVREKSEREK